MDKKIKVIIAEDNIDAQEIILSFIKPLSSFEIIDITDNGESLLESNFRLKPDLIIADINMPKLNGVEAVASCLKTNFGLKFIFTTAYDQYAVRAFDLNAIDYVMKPIKKERLYVALEKAKSAFINKYQIGQKFLTVKMERITYFIQVSKIIFIEKNSRKTLIHTIEQTYETNEPLDHIMQQLNNNFFRTHRSFIINLNYVSHITYEGETNFVHFKNYPDYVHVSKFRKNELLKRTTEL